MEWNQNKTEVQKLILVLQAKNNLVLRVKLHFYSYLKREVSVFLFYIAWQFWCTIGYFVMCCDTILYLRTLMNKECFDFESWP